jgi:hypothetical protein
MQLQIVVLGDFGFFLMNINNVVMMMKKQIHHVNQIKGLTLLILYDN